MLCIIPLLCRRGTGDIIICGIKYFISQSRASLIYLFGLIVSTKLEGFLVLSVLAIVFKLGLPPFHRWLLSIIFKINYYELFLILTLQKVIPLIILSQIGLRFWLLILIITRGGFYLFVRINSNCSISYILFLSSVRNGGFIIRRVLVGSWAAFLAGYSIILVPAVMLLSQVKSSKLRDLRFGPLLVLVGLAVQFFNLGGVPPLIGFSVKLIVLKSLTSLRLGLILVLLLTSFLVLYIYLTLFFQVYCVYLDYDTVGRVENHPRGVALSFVMLLTLRGIGWFIV